MSTHIFFQEFGSGGGEVKIWWWLKNKNQDGIFFFRLQQLECVFKFGEEEINKKHEGAEKRGKG